MKILDMPPFAPVLMESTRAMGYSLESAVADIIDNSIAANASNVDIQFSPYDAVPFISILDLFKYHSNYFNHSKKIVIELDENITMYNEKIETINIYIDNE